MKLYNSLSRSKQEFVPLDNKKVTIYVCGITPYDTTHLGHAFTYIAFDALIKYLKFKGLDVEYTQNVTDINDKDNDILKRAKEQNISWKKLASYWTKHFLLDMKNLNWTPPQNYLWASKEIPSMILIIKKLIKNNLGYAVNGSVYLDISKVKDFGKLSGFSKSKMLKVAKNFEEDLNNLDKKNPLDITLWRAAKKTDPKHIPSFSSPFGKGRPGWHIECSAMATCSLGTQIDIHGGGIDLIYPHHEAEIAQSEGATGKIPFSKFWIHTGSVYYQGKKMSKSLGNLVMVSDLLKKYSPQAIRWVLLSHHYSKAWEFKILELQEAEKIIKSLQFKKSGLPKEFINALENNLDTPKALEVIKKTGSKEAFKMLGF